MVKDHATVWESCLQNIRNNVNMQAFRTWFEPIKPVRLDGNALTIQVPNKYFYEWLEEHYVSLLKTSIRSQLGDKGRLEYQILVNDSREEEKRKHVAVTNGSYEKDFRNPEFVSRIQSQ